MSASLATRPPPTAEASTASLGAAVSAAEFIARPNAHSGEAPVVTSRGYVAGALFPSVDSLAAALRALRGVGRTEDVVGLLIPLEGDDPDAGIVRARRDPAPPRGFKLVDFLMTALDPHRPSGWQAGWAPGKNAGAAVDLLGDLTRWLVGIQAVRIHGTPSGESLWALGRPNHAAAIHNIVDGDSQEGYIGTLATYAVAEPLAPYVAERLVAGDCVLTTCESDANRAKNDARIMRKAGAFQVFDLVSREKTYGERQA